MIEYNNEVEEFDNENDVEYQCGNCGCELCYYGAPDDEYYETEWAEWKLAYNVI